MKLLISISICIFIVACGNNEYKEITSSEFIDYEIAPLSNTIHQGSDAYYHYFVYSNGKTNGKWKLLKKDINLNCELPIQENIRGMFISKQDNGSYTPWPCLEKLGPESSSG